MTGISSIRHFARLPALVCLILIIPGKCPICDNECPDQQRDEITARIAEVHRIIEAVAVPICAHARLRWIKPVGLDEQAEAGVVVACIEVLQARIGVETLAGVAFGLVGTGEAEHFVKRLTKGCVAGGFDQAAVCCGDQFDRTELALS